MRRERGFTLVEIMVVVIIIGLLAGIVSVRVFSYLNEAKINKAKTDLSAIANALELFRLDNGVYPPTEEGLKALIEKTSSGVNWREGGYLSKRSIPKDPWGEEYVYKFDGENFIIYSKGPNRIDEQGSGDDIVHGEEEKK